MKSFFRILGCVAAVFLSGNWTAPGADTKMILPEYHTVTLDNGIVLLLMERHQLPLVNFKWLLKSGGSVSDPVGQEGLASITAQLLRKGTKTRTATQISEELDFVGASFSASAGHDYASGEAECVTKHTPRIIDLLADMLLNPTFPADEVEKLIKQEIDGIAEEKAVPNEVLGRYFERFAYGSHPYGRPSSGTEKTLAAIKTDDIKAFHAKQYCPNQLILAVVGDFETAQMESAIREKFGKWERKPATVPELKPSQPVAGRKVLLVAKPDSTQTFFRIGNIGLARTNADWVPLQVVNTLFGGRFTSMINSELRIKSGLTYGARSFFTAHPLPGLFAVSSFTKNDTTKQALEMTLDVLKRVHREGITAEQLQSAKTYIKGQFGPTLETNDQLAAMITELEFYGLGPDYINRYFDRVDAVTLEDSRRLVDTYFPSENFGLVLIGKAEVINPAGEALSKNRERKSITDPGF